MRQPDAIWWGVEWRSKNAAHLQWQYDVRLYRTRRECRDFINERFGYIRTRPDLKAAPHGWRMPRAVRVEVRRVKR